MKLNQCVRCGCFFTQESEVCPNCKSLDQIDVNSVKKYISNSKMPISVEALAYSSGVSVKTINRLLKLDDFAGYQLSTDKRTLSANPDIKVKL